MSTPLGTPLRQAKHGTASNKSLSMAAEYKKLLNEQHHRLSVKHQQDLDLIDDIRGYVKARLSIERDYSSALGKLAKHHSSHIAKKFTLLNQCDTIVRHDPILEETSKNDQPQLLHDSEVSDSRLQKRLANNGLDEPDKPCSLYKVWSEHINRLQATSKNRADQFEQLIMVADKLKDIRSHKASIGKKCLETHLKKIHEDIVASMIDVEKTRKLYYEDESQAKKARENEEKIKKKRSGLLTKFTDLQAKKEKTSAQREANDIQSTQARNDYIMALAAGNAHLQHYYKRDLVDFIHIIDDGVLDHCKIFMATLSECDINSLKDALTSAQYWSKMINLTGSQKTNTIFFECEQSLCLHDKSNLIFEPCNNDPVRCISLEHNADYALQHEIDKWFTWFKKECRNLSQLVHQLEVCQRAFAEGKKSIELNGQNTEDLEQKIIELKQQIRKCEAAKLKAQARLKVIKEGGMQIEEWSAVESEIRADMAQAQAEIEAKRAKQELQHEDSNDSGQRQIDCGAEQQVNQAGYIFDASANQQVTLQVSKDSDDSDEGGSVNNMATISRSTSNMMQKQQNAASGYSALTDPSLVWQDDYSNAWGVQASNYNVVVDDTQGNDNNNTSEQLVVENSESNRYDRLDASSKHNVQANQQSQVPTSMTVQSSSPLSAIIDGVQSSSSPYQAMMGDAYKSDYECDYNRNHMRSTASSVETYNQFKHQVTGGQMDQIKKLPSDLHNADYDQDDNYRFDRSTANPSLANEADLSQMVHKRVVTLYTFDKTNEDDLAFSENEILYITDINDADWVKARNEATGEEGYVPTSYVRLMNDSESIPVGGGVDEIAEINESESAKMESAWDTQVTEQRDLYKDESSVLYCRALYDYEPEANTYEDDGLPHLALVQGELMRIIDQGTDDGWWLVEKEETNTRGHVPSMLVEELDPDNEDQELDGDENDFYSEDTDEDEVDQSVKVMPSFKPPVLDEVSSKIEKIENESLNGNAVCREAGAASSLIPTSFIIIEPTPEVESRSLVGSDIPKTKIANEIQTDDRKIIHDASVIPADVSYSVVNEDFILEKPSRRPVCHSEPEQLAPMGDEPSYDLSSRTPDGNYEPLSEVDSLDTPAPPSVVIDSFEDCKLDRRASYEDDDDDADDNDQVNGASTELGPSAYKQREIKHTGNVDVSPLLRHRAEEFSKQIIAEALMLAPGADLGPSTSSAGT